MQQGHLYFIFMEVASGGELFDQVIDNGANAMPEHKARGFMTQLLAGVAHCHKRGVAHRDLKLENVLLTSTGVVKVIDFGLSHVYPRDADGRPDRSTALKECCGSKSYAAPGAQPVRLRWLRRRRVVARRLPLRDGVGLLPARRGDEEGLALRQAGENQFVGATVRSVYGWYKRPSDHLTPALVDLLDNMLMMEPSKRASMAEVLAHPWLQGPTAAGGVDAPAWRRARASMPRRRSATARRRSGGRGFRCRARACRSTTRWSTTTRPSTARSVEGRLEVPLPVLGRRQPSAAPTTSSASSASPSSRATGDGRATTTISRQWTADSGRVARGGVGKRGVGVMNHYG